MENLEQQLQAKADMVAYAILTLTDEIASGFERDSMDVKKSTPEAKEALHSLITYTNLFHTEQFFFERLPDPRARQFFISKLESHFNVESNHPKEFLRKIREVENPLQYFGSEAIKIIGGNHDALLTMDLTIIYSSFLLHGFYDGLNRAWNLVSDYPNI